MSDWKLCVALRFDGTQLIGPLSRLMNAINRTPDDEVLTAFTLELPRSRFIVAPHRIRFLYQTTLYGSSTLYDVYVPSAPPKDFPYRQLAEFLTKNHVAGPITHPDRYANHRW